MRPPPGCGPLPSNGMPRSKIAPRLTSWAGGDDALGRDQVDRAPLVVVAPAAPVAETRRRPLGSPRIDVSSLAAWRDQLRCAAAVTPRQDPLPRRVVL